MDSIKQLSKPRSISMTDDQYQRLMSFGNGNASFGLRSVMAVVNELDGMGMLKSAKEAGCLQLKAGVL